MWKITTRGFTLEEVLIMAVMNLLTRLIPPPNELDLPRIICSLDNRTNTVLQVTCRVEYDIATQRALEISVIQHIKELGAKLGG